MVTKIEIRTTESQPFVLLPTYVNGKGPFEFVLDTGAGISIMTEQLAIDYQHNVLSLSSPSDRKGDAQWTTGIPLRLAKPNRPIILVDALVNRQKIYQFTLDTGASQTIVSPGLARQMGVQGSPAGSLVGAGGAVQSSAGILKSLSVEEAQVEKVTVVVSDIFSPLNQAVDASMDGILGYNFLKKFTIILDYPNEMLRFQKQ